MTISPVLALIYTLLVMGIAALAFLVWDFREKCYTSKMKEYSFQWQTMYQAVTLLEAKKKQIQAQNEPDRVLN
ncbi:TPA: hypothetical protein QDB06_000771 [Burkholderia vietnamiensis]|nr:hypothetical protein [Burkholderia vietnamiensis]